MTLRLGVDTGGTFTDFVWLDENGRMHIHKQLSTPHDPSEAILNGIEKVSVPETADIVHGTTVATNALLERRGARTALISTAGFADVLAIGRQNRPDIYALVPQKQEPLVPKKWRFAVEERVTAQGEVLIPLNLETVQPILQKIEEEEIESVAICLLFSFLHPKHEQQIRDEISNFQSLILNNRKLQISLSCEILPEYREYERTSTTVINAYVAPLMATYLRRLATGVAPRKLSVMQSNGGVIGAETAASQAARTALSGPAGGVVGAHYLAQQIGIEQIITFDMGGTSSDVALCPGQLPTSAEGEVGGMPLRLPMLDIHTVGAGGGSLAYVDAGGALHVGSQSAGANPGPACYGRSLAVSKQSFNPAISQPPMSRATVTDANLILGRLDADNFLGGKMRLDETAAREALSALAQQMNVASAETAAWGVLQIANANMERAIRKVSVERGYDPREFTLLPFGGAGPLHACELAQTLQIPRIMIPPTPGVLSAMGMLVAAPTMDFSQTVMVEIGDWGSGAREQMQAMVMLLQERALAEMVDEGFVVADVRLHYFLDVRYKGQSHELKIPFALEWGVDEIVRRFHEAHRARYGYAQLQEAVEVVTVRITAVSPVTPPQLEKRPLQAANIDDAILGEKEVWFNEQPLLTKRIERTKLSPGNQFHGPAILFQYDTTIVIPPEWETAVDAYRNLILTRPDIEAFAPLASSHVTP